MSQRSLKNLDTPNAMDIHQHPRKNTTKPWLPATFVCSGSQFLKAKPQKSFVSSLPSISNETNLYRQSSIKSLLPAVT